MMLLCLPLNYALELGFFAAVGFYKFKKMRRAGASQTDVVLTILLFSALLPASFLASVALDHNDLGWRVMLIAQFVLLLWAVEWVSDRLLSAVTLSRPRWHTATAGIVLLGMIGLAGTVCDALLLRFYSVAIDYGHGADENPVLGLSLGSRTAELRQIYTQVLKGLPASALVQEQPLIRDAIQQGLYSSWGSSARGRWDLPFDSANRALYLQTEGVIAPVFGQPVSLAYVSNVCLQTGIGAFVVQDFDPVWQHADSWIWAVQPLYSGKHTRAYSCTDITRSVSVHP